MARWDAAWRARLDRELAALPSHGPKERTAIRRQLGADPVAFAIIYLSHHLKGRDGTISFAGCHFEWARLGLSWTGHEPATEPADDRHAVVAPRETGKSTWWYLILPLWAAAYGHKQFIAAFAHSTTQAEQHLATFKRELDVNAQLRADFPDLCTLARRSSGIQVADRAGMLHCSSGFVFGARGIDSQALGMKVGETRPDLLILDDIEPDEAKYSADLVRKRLGTVTDAILPMNIYATVVVVGTVQIPGSIIHQFVRAGRGEKDEDNEWIWTERFKVHHHRALLEQADGSLTSLWPEKWPLAYLLSIQGTRSYAKNYDNDPPDGDGSWWRDGDVVYGAAARDEYERVVLLVDGAVTRKNKSDYTGLAVVGLDVEHKRFDVLEAIEVRQIGEDLRATVLRLIHEHGVSYVLVESNQGGDLWYTVFHDMPIKVSTFTQSERKEVRLRRLLATYQRAERPVRHARRHAAYERRLMAYPKTDHDDVIDAVAAACEHLTWMLLRALGKVATPAAVRQYQYTGATSSRRRQAA